MSIVLTCNSSFNLALPNILWHYQTKNNAKVFASKNFCVVWTLFVWTPAKSKFGRIILSILPVKTNFQRSIFQVHSHYLEVYHRLKHLVRIAQCWLFDRRWTQDNIIAGFTDGAIRFAFAQ
jgi:hypothetical protein